MSVCIGIDLGTTYSCVAVYKDNDIIIIENENGNRITPSYVTILENEIIVGDTSKSLTTKYHKNTIYDIKRFMGNKFSDPIIQEEIKNISYIVKGDEYDRPYVDIDGKKYYPEEISSYILSKMKNIAEKYLGQTIDKVVITVPAYFNDAQRTATKNAALIAKLDCIRIINEPTSAALAYGLNKSGENNILIFDLGGGTLDVSILNFDNNVFSVIAVSGDTHLGGEDFDNKLMSYCIDEFKKINKYDNINIDNKKRNNLKKKCEIAKKNLSNIINTEINVENFYDNIDLEIKITRVKFEDLCSEYFKRCLIPIKNALNDSNMSIDKITDIVLIGGSTRIPKIRSMLSEYFKKEPKININPDEAVAYGAAIQASLLMGEELTSDVVIIDAIPLTLGIETAGGLMSPIIKKNTKIPCEKEELYTTYSDNQPNVTIKIYEGERQLTQHNNLLGKFVLSNIPPMPRGIPKINVKFNVDINGIVLVTAKEISSGNTKNIVIKNDNSRLSKEELEIMYRNAEEYFEKDKENKEKIEFKIKFESDLYKAKNYVNNLVVNDDYLSDLEKLKHLINENILWLENEQSKDDIIKKTELVIEEITSILNKITK